MWGQDLNQKSNAYLIYYWFMEGIGFLKVGYYLRVAAESGTISKKKFYIKHSFLM